jgi:hypothetical protein
MKASQQEARYEADVWEDKTEAGLDHVQISIQDSNAASADQVVIVAAPFLDVPSELIQIRF